MNVVPTHLTATIGTLVLVAVFVGVLIFRNVGPVEMQPARLVSMTNSPGSEGGSAIVNIEAPDGSILQFSAPRRLMVGCRLGEKVEIVRRRFTVEMGPRGCRLDD